MSENEFINKDKATIAEIAEQFEKIGIGTKESNILNLFYRFKNDEFGFDNNMKVQIIHNLGRADKDNLLYNKNDFEDYYHASYGIKYAIKLICAKAVINNQKWECNYSELFIEPIMFTQIDYITNPETYHDRFKNLSKKHCSILLKKYFTEDNNLNNLNEISLPSWYEALPEEYKERKTPYISLPAMYIPEEVLIELLLQVDILPFNKQLPKLFIHFSKADLPIYLNIDNQKNIKTIIQEFRECFKNQLANFHYRLSNQIQIYKEDFHHWIRLGRNKENTPFEQLEYNNKFWGNEWDNHLKNIFSKKNEIYLKDFVHDLESELWVILESLNKEINFHENEKFSYPNKFLPYEIKESVFKHQTSLNQLTESVINIDDLAKEYYKIWKLLKDNIYKLLIEEKIKIEGTIGLNATKIEKEIFVNLIESNQINFSNSTIPSQNIYGLKVFILKPKIHLNNISGAQKTDTELWKIFIVTILKGKFDRNNTDYASQAIQAWNELSREVKYVANSLRFFDDSGKPIRQNIMNAIKEKCNFGKTTIYNRIVTPFIKKLFQ